MEFNYIGNFPRVILVSEKAVSLYGTTFSWIGIDSQI